MAETTESPENFETAERVETLYELLRHTTVRLRVPQTGEAGTGFFVAPGLILTCAHVIASAPSSRSARSAGAASQASRSIEVQWQGACTTATVQQSWPDLDLALLQVTLTGQWAGHPCAWIAPEVQPFQHLYSFGYSDQYPGGQPATFEVEGLQDARVRFKLGNVRPGLSGAPLLNKQTGEVCAVMIITLGRDSLLGGYGIRLEALLQSYPQLRTLQQDFHDQNQQWTRLRAKHLKNRSSSGPVEPQRIWNVPFPRNPFFTGREEELASLARQLQQTESAVIGQVQGISGLGGVGKTQLAVEYACRHRDEYRYVLWARAESGETLISSFTEIARLLELPEREAQEQEITVRAVTRWLQQQPGWLLILDNADEPALLADFLPPVIGGHLLITTRAADISGHVAGLGHPLEVKTFSEEQAALFLLHRAGLLALEAPLEQAPVEEQQEARVIARELGELPLALDQAGAYLKATRSRLSAYLPLYQQHRAKLLAQRRGAEHPESVATTFLMSFERVTAQNPAAADLLRLCAFLGPEAIPETILTADLLPVPLSQESFFEKLVAKPLAKLMERISPYPVLQWPTRASHPKKPFLKTAAPLATDAFLLNEAIESLRRYSLIERNPQSQDLTVHRLVQAVLRESLPPQEQQQWMQQAIEAVEMAYPGPEFASWPQMERLLPHALACAAWIEQTPISSLPAAFLLNQTGYYLKERARYEEAEPLYQRALSIREQQLGPAHPDMATSLNNLAALYKAQGRYEEAEPLYQRALAICEQQLGPAHPHTATSLNNLAGLYRVQGRYEEAEPLFQRALAIRAQQLGPAHPHTASSLNNLAGLYQDQGRYEEAEPLYQRALSIREQQLGPAHPDTATSLNSLAGLYDTQGRYAEAEPLFQRALAIREQQLGPQHPHTASSLNNLALLYDAQGRYAEAEPLYQRALAICEQQLGPAHPHTATSLNNLALLYRTQGRYGEAEPLYQRALAICEQQLGPQHPDTASSLNNLALLYRTQGRYGEAEPLYQRALAICEQQLGPAHPLTATSLHNLAGLYDAQGRYEEAEPLLQRALAIYEQQLGPAHPHTATSLNNLAGLYDTQGRYAEAEPLYQRALAIREQQLGPAHPDTAQSLNSLALLYRTQGRYGEAEPLYQRALAIREQQLGPAHPHTASSLNSLAALYKAQGRYEEAEPLYQRALAIREQQLGPLHPQTQQIRGNYQVLLAKIHADGDERKELAEGGPS